MSFQIDIIEKSSVDEIIHNFKEAHPNTIEKAIKLFKSIEYKNFSIEHSHICLYGLDKPLNLSAKIEDDKLRTYTLWQYDKVEIILSEEHLNEIEYDTDFDPHKLKHQPFKTYYVKLNLPIVHGFFISKGFYLNDEDFYKPLNSSYNSNELFLSIVLYDDLNNISHANFNINLLDSGDLKQILKNAWYNFMQITPFQALQKIPKEALDELIEIALFAINTMYYIYDLNKHQKNTFDSPIHNHTSHNDLLNKTQSQSQKMYTRDFINSHPTTIINITQDKIIKNSITKSSHIRKGHWHNYWVGKRNSPERRLILKWIDDIAVNCKDRKKLPNVKIKT